MPKQEDVKVVPPRRDPDPLEPYAKSQALQIKGARPGFVQQWIRADQIAHYTNRHEIGDQWTGYLMVDPWSVVLSDSGITTGRPSDAQGTSTDTTVTNGELWLIETTEQNHAKYAVIERKRQELIEARFVGGEKHSFGKTSFKTRTAGGRAALDASATDVLNGA